MSKDVDYNKVGMRCGIEIHQRIDTKKLFCNCDSAQKNEPTLEIHRKLRPVAGELGDIDPAAQFEFLKSKEFVYKLSPNESCLVECDEEPPHPLNEEALKISLQVCKLLNCDIPDEIHVMRKTVIDGSNTGGFQRTAIVGLNGYLETSFGKIGIQSICLEEESARIITEPRSGEDKDPKSEGKVTYRLNGLGIPLVEIATSSDIHSPKQAKEVAEKIGLLLRSTKVQRGIGTIRQDINISIREGARVEIKGFQELEKIPKLVENEVARQISLIEIKKELQKRGCKMTEYNNEREARAIDTTKIFEKTKCNFIRRALNDGSKVYAFMLPKFAGLMNKQCGDRTFAKELHAYAQSYGMGIIHGDEQLEKYQIKLEFEQLSKKFKIGNQDIIVIITGKVPEVEKTCNAIIERAKQCLIGVPEETRVADTKMDAVQTDARSASIKSASGGFGSKYTRPLPGSERMYPETDIPVIRLTKKMREEIETPETLEEKKKQFEKELPKDLAHQIIHSKYLNTYESLIAEKIDPILAASTLVNTIKALNRDDHDTEKLTEDDIRLTLLLVKHGKIPKDSVPDALIARINGDPIEYIENKFKTIDEKQIRETIKKVIRQVPGQKESVYMGLAMKELRGIAPGELVIKILRQEMK